MKKTIALSVLFLGVTFLAGYGWQQFQIRSTEKITEAQQSIREDANWQTYLNDKYKYQVDYPRDVEYVKEAGLDEFGPSVGKKDAAYWEGIYNKYTGKICVYMDLKDFKGNVSISVPENNDNVNKIFKYVGCGSDPNDFAIFPDYAKVTKLVDDIEIDGQKYKIDVYNVQSPYPGNNILALINLSDGTIIELTADTENWEIAKKIAESYRKIK